MISNGIRFDPIYAGSKLMSVEINSELGMKLLDTLNYFPMALKNLPKAFGFEGQKGDFPHFFNTPDNQNYIGE